MIDRRRFTLGAAALAVSGARSRGGEASRLPIVDTHQHLWDATKFDLPWIKKSKRLNRSFLTADYLKACAGLNVVKAVYMEVAVVPAQHAAEAAHVVALCRRQDAPTAAAVIGGRPGEDGFRDYIRRYKGSPYIRGVRRILGAKTDFLAERFVADIRLLGDLDMSFDLCTAPQRLAAAAKLVDACPDTRFVIDHCGNAAPNAFAGVKKGSHDPDRWRRDMAALARRTNTICKISGIVARMKRDTWDPGDLAPVVDHCLDSFGPDRVVFGSDWPVCLRGATLRQWVDALGDIIGKRSAADRRKLLHDNAVMFYRLS